MAHAVFGTIAVNTLIFSVLFGCVLLIRSGFGKRLSATVRYALWLAVAVRLLIPVSFTLLWNPYPLLHNVRLSPSASLPAGTAAPAQIVAPQAYAAAAPDVHDGSVPEAGSATALTASPVPAGARHAAVDWEAAAVYGWAAGIAWYAVWLGIRAVQLRRKIARCGTGKTPRWMIEEYERCRDRVGIRREIRIAVQGFLPMPAIMGALKPVLIVPDRLARSGDAEKARHAFVHELTHYRRRDVWVICGLNLINAVYWFNPLIWLFVRLVRQDMETVCDNMALRTLGADSRSEYIRTILFFSGKQQAALAHAGASLFDGCAGMQKRIKGMFLAGKTKRPVKIAVAALACLLVFAGFTSGYGLTPDMAKTNGPAILAASANGSGAGMVSGADGVSFEPSAGSAKSIIKIPSYYDGASLFDGMLARLNGMLANTGLNVSVAVRQGTDMKDSVRREAASGACTATSYALDRPDSEELFNDGITMEMTDPVRQNAGAYYSRYSDLFPEKLSGVPVAIYRQPLWLKTALMLRSDFERAGGGIDAVPALFDFLDHVVAAKRGEAIVIAEPYYLINEWALEQGYYSLDAFGIKGYLYAGIDDPCCTPVTLEGIPGFRGFFDRLCAYYRSGTLAGKPEFAGTSGIIGYVASLHVYYSIHPKSTENWIPWVEGEFTAHEFSPGLPSHMVGPFYSMELAVPASASPEGAADVTRFVEWLYADQANYDSVLYGEEGVDFRDEGGKFSPLVGGRNVEMTPSDGTNKFFFTWPGSNVLCNSDFRRLPSGTPAGVEEAVNEGLKRNIRFPLCAGLNAFDTENGAMLATAGDADGIADRRQRLFDNFLFHVPNAIAMRNKEDIAALLDGLSTGNNAELIQGYKETITKRLNNKT